MSVKIIDNSKRFVMNNDKAMDRMLERMAKDIRQIAMIRIPYKSGALQRDLKQKRISSRHHQVKTDNIPYAAYQERGMRADGSRRVRKYTTPGTGKEFLKRAGDSVSAKAVQYFRQAASSVRV